MDRNRSLMIGAVLAAVIIVVGGFLLGIQPQLQAASAAAASQVTVDTQNDQLTSTITQLRSKFAKIDDLKTQLGLLRKSVPTDADSAAFLTEIDSLASSTGVTVTNVTQSTPAAYLAPVVAATTPAAASGTSTSGTSSSGTSSSASASPAPTPTASTPASPVVTTSPLVTAANFTDIPVSVQVTGDNTQGMAFLQALRNGDRLFLVTGITSATNATTSSGSTSASSAGSMTWTVTGLIYALSDGSTASK